MAHIILQHIPLEDPEDVGLDTSTLGLDLNMGRYGSLKIEYTGSESLTEVPIFAYIHSGIAFGLAKTCPSDSGRAGTAYLPNGYRPETLIAQLDQYFNNDYFVSDEEYDIGGTMQECVQEAEANNHTYEFNY